MLAQSMRSSREFISFMSEHNNALHLFDRPAYAVYVSILRLDFQSGGAHTEFRSLSYLVI